jgi:AcrR family transcriptional regulator
MPKRRPEPTPDRAPDRTRDTRPEPLPERCVRAAHAIIDAEGVEALSLREVARRLGVSHQAPYKHFASRDHLLAEVVRRAFEAFARHLDARPAGATADEDLAAMGRAYLAYAHTHPLQYRLMFGTPLPTRRAPGDDPGARAVPGRARRRGAPRTSGPPGTRRPRGRARSSSTGATGWAAARRRRLHAPRARTRWRDDTAPGRAAGWWNGHTVG